MRLSKQKKNGKFQNQESRYVSDEKTAFRVRIVISLLLVFLVLECIGLVYKSALIPRLNSEADMFRETGILRAENKRLVCGDIVDRNGKTIVHNELETQGEGKNKVTYQKSTYLDKYAFTQVVGYTGGGQSIEYKKIKDPDTYKMVWTFEEKRDDYRLMRYLSHGDQNILYKAEDLYADHGNRVMLTLDADFQIWLMNFLKEQIGEGEYGSITVLDARTGAIIGMAAQPTFSADQEDRKQGKTFADSVKGEKEDESVDLSGYPLTHKWSVRPGSIFKLLTAAALIENGMEDFTAPDEPFRVGKTEFSNSYERGRGILDFKEGFRYSSNVFFAHAAIELGYDKMTDMVRRFSLEYDGETGDGKPIDLDFGRVETNWNLADKGDAGLGMTGFGYAGTELSGVSAAMMMSAFANGGVIMTPHLIRQVSDADENGRVRAKEEISVMANPISKETADKITDALQYTVEGYISDGKISDRQAEIFRKYKICAKTGTGDIENQTKRKTAGPNAAWVASYAPAYAGENEARYVVIMNHIETGARGSRYLDAVGEVYDYIFTHLQ